MEAFNKTIIPLTLVGYEMIIANSALRASLATIISYPTRTRGIIVNYFSDVIPLCIRLYTPEAFAVSIKCHMIMIILHHRRNSLFSWGEGKGGGGQLFHFSTATQRGLVNRYNLG